MKKLFLFLLLLVLLTIFSCSIFTFGVYVGIKDEQAKLIEAGMATWVITDPINGTTELQYKEKS